MQHSEPSSEHVVHAVVPALVTKEFPQLTEPPLLLPIAHVFAVQHSNPSSEHVVHAVVPALVTKEFPQLTGPPLLLPVPHVLLLQHAVVSFP